MLFDFRTSLRCLSSSGTSFALRNRSRCGHSLPAVQNSKQIFMARFPYILQMVGNSVRHKPQRFCGTLSDRIRFVSRNRVVDKKARKFGLAIFRYRSAVRPFWMRHWWRTTAFFVCPGDMTQNIRAHLACDRSLTKTSHIFVSFGSRTYFSGGGSFGLWLRLIRDWQCAHSYVFRYENSVSVLSVPFCGFLISILTYFSFLKILFIATDKNEFHYEVCRGFLWQRWIPYRISSSGTTYMKDIQYFFLCMHTFPFSIVHFRLEYRLSNISERMFRGHTQREVTSKAMWGKIYSSSFCVSMTREVHNQNEMWKNWLYVIHVIKCDYMAKG